MATGTEIVRLSDLVDGQEGEFFAALVKRDEGTDKHGNPYYLSGEAFHGIGGPHVGLSHAWPMSVLVQAMTSESDDEISQCLGLVKNVSRNGLVHERCE